MQDSEPRTPLLPPVYGVHKQNKSNFSLDEHQARMARVFADFEEYRRTLGDIEKRVESLEEKSARAMEGSS